MSGLFGSKPISVTENKISALRIQSSAYGIAIPLVYGKTRISTNLLWTGDFQAIPHTASQGGKGGSVMESTSYTYQTAVAFSLCEGPITDVGKTWVDTALYDTPTAIGLSIFTGAYPQLPFGYLSTYHPTEALSYPGLAYVASGTYDLGSNSSLGNHSFEITGFLPYSATIRDANPAAVLVDFLTHTLHGAGFPSNRIGDLTAFSNWCVANGLFVSPAYTEQRQASEIVAELVAATGCEIVWSEGMLKVIPYGDAIVTGNGVTYTPSLTPVADLTDDDFIVDGDEDPVVGERKSPSDTYNQVSIEFTDRNNQYNNSIATASDQTAIETQGLRQDNVKTLHLYTNASAAQLAAQLMLQRVSSIRNTYQFKLGWKYARLEPMDIVTLTDAGMGLYQAPVRITEIHEDEYGLLAVTAEEILSGTASAPPQVYQAAAGNQTGSSSAPGSALAPLIFEPPLSLSNGVPQVALATGGMSQEWGGCHVWASYDGTTYKVIGTINAAARYGVLHSALPAPSSDPDTVNTLSIDLTSGTQLISGSQADADNRQTLCLAGDELLTYQTATLTGLKQYALTYLRRGLDSTPTAAKAAGAAFVRLDSAVFSTDKPADSLGKTLHIKLTSFNLYGQMEQDVSTVTDYVYVISGNPIAPPAGLVLQSPVSSSQFTVQWAAVTGATGYVVQIWTGATLRRSFSVVGNTANYTSAQATADGAEWRTFTVKVASQCPGKTSAYTMLTVYYSTLTFDNASTYDNSTSYEGI